MKNISTVLWGNIEQRTKHTLSLEIPSLWHRMYWSELWRVERLALMVARRVP